ncbi:MAG TPA: DMT family transporter [Thermoleophilaceae bacterium]|nr:DMT family transporter [Thermoleophilaceae bacterium]
MSGVLWATASGIGFGLFQSLNRRAIRGIEDPYVSTFLQLAVATGILVLASLVSEDLRQLGDASGEAITLFALAGVIHFVLGWLLLNVSQMRIGASRTAPLITLTPLFGVFLAAVTLGELPAPAALAAIVPVMVGAWLLASRGSGHIAIERDTIFAFGTAFMWALSAVLTVEALEGLDSPLLGVTLGLLAATATLGGALLARGSPFAVRSIATGSLALKLLAAAVVAFATWFRLLALDVTDVAVVLATNLVSVPITLVLAPIMVGRHLEQADARVWLGGVLIVAGVLALIGIEG